MLMHINPERDREQDTLNDTGCKVYSFASDEIFRKLCHNRLRRASLLAQARDVFNSGSASEMLSDSSSAANLFERRLWLISFNGKCVKAFPFEADTEPFDLTFPGETSTLQLDWNECDWLNTTLAMNSN
jgi:hypothetical protein